MDAGARQSLKRYFFTAIIIMAVVSAVVWTVPALLGEDAAPTPTVAVTTPDVIPEELDRFMEDALRRIGATEVISREDDDGVIRGIFQLPRGTANSMVGQRLRRFAEEAEMELYASPVDGLDLEVRAYAGANLRQQLLLVPDLPDPPRFNKSIRSLDRPLIAIIVVDVGDASADAILKTTVPITVAIRPYTPFALRSARLAASSWHEVLAHVPREMTPQEAQRAVPLATGIWFDGTPVAPLGAHDVVVVPADRVSGARTPDALRVLPAQRSDRQDSMSTLNRARHIAARMGQSALVVTADDPALSDILAWAKRAHQDGYRLVLASEAARPTEITGPNGTVATR
jgi:hypothetical protein